MAVTIGDIVEGKVVNITKFGAFIELSSGESGLVHISEISRDYVENIAEHLKKDQEVKAKVLSNKDGKLSLSIKQAQPKKEKQKVYTWEGEKKQSQDMSFEDKISKFLKESSEKMDQIKCRDSRRGNSYNARKNYDY